MYKQRRHSRRTEDANALENAVLMSETKPMHILFLTLDIFRQTGGIQQVNKLLLHVLNNTSSLKTSEKTFTTYSLYDKASPGTQNRSELYSGYLAFSGNIIRFIGHCLAGINATDVIILSHINLLPLAMLMFRLKPQIRMVMLAHGVEVRKKLALWKISFMHRNMEIWAVSRFTARCLKKIDQRMHVEILNNALPPNFIVPNRFDKPEGLLKKHDLSSDHRVLLSVCRIGRNEQDKGVEQVIRCIPSLLAIFPKLCYLIIGKTENDEQRRLETLIATLNLAKHVRFLQFVPQHELSNYYLLADVFVMPSKREGFGIAFIEAAACGSRIIAGNADGSADALLDGAIGTLIDADDPEQLQKAVIHHLKTPRDNSQAAAIQEKCLRHFSTQAYQERIAHLLYNPFPQKNPIKNTPA